MDFIIRSADTTQKIRNCYPVMFELRPHLSEGAFLSQVERQLQGGYQLVYLEEQGEVKAVAGFRISECLAWGRFLYVDDLVTRSGDRSRGFGGLLLDWLVNEAAQRGCAQLHLDSGVQRFGAHRFYLSRRLNITSHHFAVSLHDRGGGKS